MKSTNVILGAFQPLALFGVLFGVFPSCNLGEKLSGLGKLKGFVVAIAVATLFRILTHVLLPIAVARPSQQERFVNAMLRVCANISHNCGGLLLLHTLFMNRKFRKFLNGWQTILDALDMNKVQSLLYKRCLFITLIVASLAFIDCVLEFIFINAFRMQVKPKWKNFDQVIHTLLPISHCLTYISGLFKAAYLSYFCLVFELAFSRINQMTADVMTTGKPNVHRHADLHKKKQKHRNPVQEIRAILHHLLKMVDQLSEYGSLALLFTLLEKSFQIYRMAFFFVVALKQGNPLVATMGFLLNCSLSIAPLALICVTADRMTKMSVESLKAICRSSLTFLTTEDQFQTQLLISALETSNARLTCGGFANVDKDLFLQICGTIVTYVIVAVQFKA